jgi:diamine N-acetyltransferase
LIPTRAVYAGKRLVGLLMYSVHKTKGKAQEVSIDRFMIDRKQQRKGYGRATPSKALQKIRAIPVANTTLIRYMRKNAVAKRFHGSLGFVEAGRDRDGEVIAVLKL